MRTTRTKPSKLYLESMIKILDDILPEQIEKIAYIIFQAYKRGRNIIALGNGGSAASASHFICDVAKGLSFSGRKRFKAFSLNDSIPLLTAYANDMNYDLIFSEQLKNIVQKKDVVIGISASGNSKNVLNAIRLANRRGAVSIGLTGFNGGKLKRLVSDCIIVNSDVTEQIEDAHLVILHAVKLLLCDLIK